MTKKMNIPFSPPDISEKEIEAVSEALRSGWITTGPRTKELERQMAEFTGTKRGACLNSATACMETALRLFGIGAGDEVIVPAYTYTASASVVCHVGATLKLIDVQEGTYHLDYDELEAAITEKTKAVIPVDIAGVMVDYDKIRAILESKKALFKPANAYQEALGRVLIYKKIMLMSLHGQSKDALAKTKLGAWEYDIIAPLYKCNMTDITAAIGLAQMTRYEGMLARRKQMINMYTEGIKADDVECLCHYTDEYSSSGHLFLTRLLGRDVEDRNQFIIRMAEAGIATNVHFKPLPMHTAYKQLGFDIKDFPKSFEMYHNEVTLPLHTNLTDEQIEYVIENFNSLK